MKSMVLAIVATAGLIAGGVAVSMWKTRDRAGLPASAALNR